MRRLTVILGPTAVGKTDYSIAQALRAGSPVISCDSRQIFREMRIGTAVPSDEQLAAVPHYFIRTRSVTEDYTAGMYEMDALALIRRLFAEGHEQLIATGGSMFYIEALCHGIDDIPSAPPELREELTRRALTEGTAALAEELKKLDPETCEEIDLQNRQRVVRALEVCLTTGRPFSSFKQREAKRREFEIRKIGLQRPREELYERINRRVDAMMAEGLEAEVRSLLPLRNCPALRTVGYQELFDCFDGKITREEAVEQIKRNTRNYAKRQMTWWRRDSDIEWLTKWQ